MGGVREWKTSPTCPRQNPRNLPSTPQSLALIHPQVLLILPSRRLSNVPFVLSPLPPLAPSARLPTHLPHPPAPLPWPTRPSRRQSPPLSIAHPSASHCSLLITVPSTACRWSSNFHMPACLQLFEVPLWTANPIISVHYPASLQRQFFREAFASLSCLPLFLPDTFQTPLTPYVVMLQFVRGPPVRTWPALLITVYTVGAQ